MYREIVTLSSKYNCQSVLYGDEVAVGGTIAFSYKLKQKLFTEGFLALFISKHFSISPTSQNF